VIGLMPVDCRLGLRVVHCSPTDRITESAESLHPSKSSGRFTRTQAIARL
jgi:hypothetical protein